MPSVLIGMTEEDRESLHEGFAEGWVHGDCYPFACALAKLTGWEIVGLMRLDPLSGRRVVWHAVVVDQTGGYWDGRGPTTLEEVYQSFRSDLTWPLDLKAVKAEELLEHRPATYGFERLIKTIEAIWPDLPEPEWCLRARTRRFAEGLEELSRRENMWVVPPVPAQLPFLAQGDEDDVGYQLKLAMTGTAYLLDRRPFRRTPLARRE